MLQPSTNGTLIPKNLIARYLELKRNLCYHVYHFIASSFFCSIFYFLQLFPVQFFIILSSDGIQNFKNRFSFVSNSLIRVVSKKKKKRSSLRIVLYTLNKHLQQIETVTLNREILKYIDYVKLKPGSLNVLKFQERVR